VPTRKQRRRRDKTFRHEYETVLIDEEGNETPLTELRTHEEPKPAKKDGGSTQKKPAGRGSRRSAREAQPPSWNRAFKRGGTWGALMIVVSIFFLGKSAPLASRVLIGVLYGVAFVPLMYFVDRMTYNAHLRRTGADGKKAAGKKK
jgi:hypothetical protein